MNIQKIDLYDYFKISKPENACGVLTAYVIGNYKDYGSNWLRPAMLVNAGGGYSMCFEGEKEPIALAYANEGFNTYTLEYSCYPCKYPTQLVEAYMAIAYIRDNAENHRTDVDHVCAIGFSAGGHLTASLGSFFNEKIVKDVFGERNVRPDAIVLGYPVITSGEYRNELSINNLCGDNAFLREFNSVEKRVFEKSSPAFIWSTFEDEGVLCENSLLLVNALRKNNVPVEFHLFEHGSHGLSLGKITTQIEYPYVQPWFKLSLEWLRSRGFVIIQG